MHVGIKVMAQTYCFFIYSKSELGIFFIKKNNYGFFSISVTLYKLKIKEISHDIFTNFTHFFEKKPTTRAVRVARSNFYYCNNIKKALQK
jgi:uncharacterized protein (DUF927 family)